MTHVSKRKLSEKTLEILEEALVEALRDNSRKETEKVITSLLTETEVKMIAKRLLIMYLLHKGESTDDITKATKTTRQTVSRMALKLKLLSSDEKELLFSKMQKWERNNKVKSLLKSILNTNVSASAQLRSIKNVKTKKDSEK